MGRQKISVEEHVVEQTKPFGFPIRCFIARVKARKSLGIFKEKASGLGRSRLYTRSGW
jgi:hypothetical protein